MKEFFGVEIFHTYTVVQLQATFFIVALSCYLELQSLWQTLLVLAAFLWYGGHFLQVEVQIAALVGILLAMLTARAITTASATKINGIKLVYALIQPTVLYYLMPCYVDQTEFPVGVILSTIAWLGLTLIVAGADGKRPLMFSIPVVTILFFTLVLYRHPWVPLGITAGLQIVELAIVLRQRK